MKPFHPITLTAMAGALAILSLSQGIGQVPIAYAVDGDSLRLGNQNIRLYGIDAPELNQVCTDHAQRSYPCGLIAKQKLSYMVDGFPLECKTMGYDHYGRTLSKCYRSGIDISSYMVRTGFAVAYRRYSLAYVADENEARLSGRGMWDGKFELPEQFRHFPKQDKDRRT